MKYQDLKERKRQPEDWITESIQVLINKERKEIIEETDQEDLEESDLPRKEEERPILLEISSEDYEGGFRKWSEMTATSPLGRHLGLYKALLGTEEISKFFAGMCELPVIYGFAPKRWTHALKLMIEKDEGKPRVSRLRVIHLLEADYNFVFRTMWGRRLVKKARDNNLFMSAQQAQPGRLAVGGILSKVISFD